MVIGVIGVIGVVRLARVGIPIEINYTNGADHSFGKIDWKAQTEICGNKIIEHLSLEITMPLHVTFLLFRYLSVTFPLYFRSFRC